jgi:hypothetical protein
MIALLICRIYDSVVMNELPKLNGKLLIKSSGFHQNSIDAIPLLMTCKRTEPDRQASTVHADKSVILEFFP